MTTFDFYHACDEPPRLDAAAPADTTTAAFYAEGLEVRVRNGGGYGPRRRPRLLLGGEALLQCRQCFVCLPAGSFYRLANRKSLCGRSSECSACQNRRRRWSKRSGRGARPEPMAVAV